jgi:hypothetical protein
MQGLGDYFSSYNYGLGARKSAPVEGHRFPELRRTAQPDHAGNLSGIHRWSTQVRGTAVERRAPGGGLCEPLPKYSEGSVDLEAGVLTAGSGASITTDRNGGTPAIFL